VDESHRALASNPTAPAIGRPALAEAGLGSGKEDQAIDAYRKLLLLDPPDRNAERCGGHGVASGEEFASGIGAFRKTETCNEWQRTEAIESEIAVLEPEIAEPATHRAFIR
jgi:hypothetical protein